MGFSRGCRVACCGLLFSGPADRLDPAGPTSAGSGYGNLDHETNDAGVIASKPEGRQTSAPNKQGFAQTSLVQANSYLLLGRYEDAMTVYKQIILTSPDLAEARYGLGVFLRQTPLL